MIKNNDIYKIKNPIGKNAQVRSDDFQLSPYYRDKIVSDDKHNQIASSDIYNEADYGMYAPVNFNKYFPKRHSSILDDDNSSDPLDREESSIFFDSDKKSRCSYSVKHLKKCNRCYIKLKKLINRKVTKKFDEIILDNKIKQIQSQSQFQPISQQQPIISNSMSDSWKQMMIMMIGIILLILIIFSVIKGFNR